MDVKSVLNELGLSEGEIKVYMALLKLGSSPVSALKEETNLHRTTIHDFIEKLLNKALVSYVIKNNVKYYSATHPQKLADFLNEKASKLNEVMPELVKMSEFHKEELKVEVFKGQEGFKTLLGHFHREKTDMYGMGFEEERYEKKMPDLMRWHFRKTKELKLHEYVFVKEGAKFLYPHETVHYKELPDEFFNPNPTMTFGDYVAILIWEPFTSILIEHKGLADSYRKWFGMLWEQNVRTIKGNDGVKRMFDTHLHDLKKGDDIVVFGSSEHIPEFFNKYFDGYIPQLIKNGVKPKIIFDEDAEYLINACKKNKWNVKTLPRKYISPIEVNVWKEKAAVVIWKKEPVAFIIDDKEVAEGFKAFFNIQWDIAKKAK